MSAPSIAIISLACEFPGASTPRELWQTALHDWRWFRNLPPQRLDAAYRDTLGEIPDTTRAQRAAVLEGYVFPRQRFALSENDLRAADFSHWLALDCAGRALRDSGLGDALPRDATRVIVGNSLTGESSRAELLRLRWPYVRKTLEEGGCSGTDEEWARREEAFKARLTPLDGRTLAGSLSNVIAGRIAHHFDLRGGCYCVDAACASSLAAVAQACSQLAAGEIECVLVGGVDVSLDPLELVGFSVAGALSHSEMRVFDERRDGFLPGEGCGFAVMMRADHPALAHRKVRALIRGWAVSSDGHHDLTSPSRAGQSLALSRAYAMAGFDIGTVPLFEAHGTGTPVGDEVELGTLTDLLDKAVGAPVAAAVGSIKANIGHTKAAAGMAGVIKVVMALQEGLLPPSPPATRPMLEVSRPGSRLRLLDKAEPWPAGMPRRAGVSGFGFGGVNAHVVLEAGPSAADSLPPKPCHQDAEIFVFDGIDREDLHRRIAKVHAYAVHLADVQLPAAAKASAAALGGRRCRAAVIAKSAGELASLLEKLLTAESDSARIHTGTTAEPPRVGFLFPGQGGKADATGGYLCSRFGADFDTTGGAAGVQARLVAGSTRAAALLADFGIHPQLCLGHSLGEISALGVAGFLEPEEAVALARNRGRVMDEYEDAVTGRMEVIHRGEAEVRELINGYPVAIAALNSPTQTVVAGRGEAVAALVADATKAKFVTDELRGHIAFHSPLMAAVAEPFAACLRKTEFSAARATLYSTVTGRQLEPGTSPTEHLVSQLTSPVRFSEAFAAARPSVDLWIEVGTARVLTGLVSPVEVLSAQTEKPTLLPLLQLLAAAFVKGVKVEWSPLYRDRCLPDFDADWLPRFFVNPCERPVPGGVVSRRSTSLPAASPPDPVIARQPLDVVLDALAMRRGPGEIIRKEDTFRELDVDSMWLVTQQDQLKKLFGRPGAARVHKDMSVAEFAALFTGQPGTEIESLSDLLVPWSRIFEIQWHQAPPLSTRSALVLDALQPLLIDGEDSIDSILTELQKPSTAPVVFLDGSSRLPGFAKSFALEHPGRKVLVLHHGPGGPPAVEGIMRELAEDFSFRELRHDASGGRQMPVWQSKHVATPRDEHPLTREDVVLVSGGAKGITAECLLALAKDSGASFALVGRSSSDDPPVCSFLGTLSEMGIRHRYAALDLADATAVAAFASTVTRELGSITMLLHGAGLHEPCAIAGLDANRVAAHCHAKVEGLRNLLDHMPPPTLKRVVAFGSVIARTGYERSAAYAYSNDAMAQLMAGYAAAHPAIVCQTLDWSAWAETGMGVDLQAITPLKAAGIDPLRSADATALFMQAIRGGDPRPVLTGRLPAMPTLAIAPAPTLDIPGAQIISFTPGVELVAGVPVSLELYPWLAGHALDGSVILPGMFAIELIERLAAYFPAALPLHDIHFTRPMTLPRDGGLTLTIQLLRDPDNTVHARLSEKGRSLGEPAVRASLGGDPAAPPSIGHPIGETIPAMDPAQGADIARDLYSQLLFHRDPFQSVARYTSATAKEVAFELSVPREDSPLASHVLLRDAIIHGIQACVPGELLLPESIGHIDRPGTTPPHHITARETTCVDGCFTYDLIAHDDTGQVTECWHGLVLRRYRPHQVTMRLHPMLQAIHRERTGVDAAVISPPAPATPPEKRYYEYRHIVGFKETNVVGNVYFTNHIEWQGRCREMFLRDHAPDVLAEIEAGRLALVTVSCSCEYEEEVRAFDEIAIRMTLEARGDDWAEMRFDYWNPATATRLATGKQMIACKNRTAGGMPSNKLPSALAIAFETYS